MFLLASVAYAGMSSNPPMSTYPDLLTQTIHDCKTQNLSIDVKAELRKNDFPQKLKDIETKLLIEFPLTRLERTAWRVLSKTLNENTDANCDRFMEWKDGLHGLCCRVRMSDKPFAFCTYEHLLKLPGNKKRNRKNDFSLEALEDSFMDTVDTMDTAERWYSRSRVRSSFQGGRAPVQIFIDLRSVPCQASEFGSLCTQYCCDYAHKSTIFCESGLACF